MCMCFVLSLVVLLFDNHIALTLSTYIVIGISTFTFIVFNSFMINLISFTTSDNAKYSDYVVDSTPLLITLLFHAIGIPQNYTKYP